LKQGHSGGKTYRERYADDGKDLYVAAIPVTLANSDLQSSFIRFVERKLILEFISRWKKPPVCNHK
jgi:hypothetical protein